MDILVSTFQRNVAKNFALINVICPAFLRINSNQFEENSAKQGLMYFQQVASYQAEDNHYKKNEGENYSVMYIKNGGRFEELRSVYTQNKINHPFFNSTNLFTKLI